MSDNIIKFHSRKDISKTINDNFLTLSVNEKMAFFKRLFPNHDIQLGNNGEYIAVLDKDEPVTYTDEQLEHVKIGIGYALDYFFEIDVKDHDTIIEDVLNNYEEN